MTVVKAMSEGVGQAGTEDELGAAFRARSACNRIEQASAQTLTSLRREGDQVVHEEMSIVQQVLLHPVPGQCHWPLLPPSRKQTVACLPLPGDPSREVVGVYERGP